MNRPAYISGRPPMFTDEQVREWRAETEERRRVMRETRSLERMAADAGICRNAMALILRGQTYKWVR